MKRFFSKKSSVVDEPIAKVLSEMNHYGPKSDEYPALVTHLERLVQLRNEEKRSRISPDTLAIVAGNLAGILIIVAYEHSHVMASKATNFVMKTRS